LKKQTHQKFRTNHSLPLKEESIPTSVVSSTENKDLFFPKPIQDSTEMIIPNIHFLSSPPFLVKKETTYIFFYRAHLAQDVDIDFDSKNRL